MNDFLTKEIELCGEDVSNFDTETISEIIHNALLEKCIDATSFAWSLNVEYFPRSNDDEV
jgi:hypothetical protein